MTAVPASLSIDATPCAREPIHIPGFIQPHGLLVILAPDFTVKHVSANSDSMLGLPAAELHGAYVSRILGDLQAERFVAALGHDDLSAFNPTDYVLAGGAAEIAVECTVHRLPAGYLVEFETHDVPNELSPVDLYAHVRAPIARMEQAPDIATLARVAASDMFAVSGFDRVMVYRFDEDWNGEVVAETKRSTVATAYFGLHFPASDIPVQARQLYVRSALRLIPDVGYEPSALVPEFDPETGQSVDLSQAILRSVSPFHIEYLKNMGVRATLTISIVVCGRLWGLIACHHFVPRRLDYGMRAVCELIGQMLAWQIDARIETGALQDELRTNMLLESQAKHSRNAGDLAVGLITGAANVLELFGAQGFVVQLEGKLWRFGATPPDVAVIAEIAAALQGVSSAGVAANDRIGELVPAAATDFGIASGALLIALSEAGDEYVLCFREEVIRTVYWGGDPHEAVAAGSMRPRASFASWRETMRGRSARWTMHDAAAARSLRRRLLERRQSIERGRAEERVRYLAHNDMLTQLPNRASFHAALLRSVEDAAQEGSALAVLFVDIDRLKLFNDAFGHATGDLMLQAAAARIRDSVRRDDIVARLGGDEFAIILPKIANDSDAGLVAAKVLAAIAEPFSVADTPELRFTASVGIALYPTDGLEPETLLRHADLAMFRAKERGRNDFQRFGTGDTLPNYERLTLERRLQHGLSHDEIVPYYQPMVSADTGKLVGLEALARWNHPELGVLSPARFIALAEESQLIVALGETMLRAACTDCVRWRTFPGHENLKVAVNVSTRQFREAGFLQTVRETLAGTGLPAEALELELTESMLMENEEYAMKTLRTLSDSGINVAIDDFGTGYSSLSQLKRLPVDSLKIDQSFIREITTLPDDTAIVRAIIAMAHSLKLSVVAEGVETSEQLEFLRGAGCDTIQGFYIGKTLDEAGTTAFIAGFIAGRVAA